MAKIRVIGKITLNQAQRERLEKLGAEYIADEDPISRTDFDEILRRIETEVQLFNYIIL